MQPEKALGEIKCNVHDTSIWTDR